MTYSSARMLQQANSAFRGNFTSIRDALLDVRGVFGSISSTTLAYLAGVTAGTGAASKAMVLDSSKNFAMPAAGIFKPAVAAVAAAGSAQSDATALTEQMNFVTGADGTKGVALPAAAQGLAIYIQNTVMNFDLPVYPVNSGNDAINGGTAGTGSFTLGAGLGAWFVATSATQWYVDTSAGSRLVNTTASTLTATHEGHGDRVVTLNRAAGIAVTLPVARGSGMRFTFIVGTTITSNTTTIKVPDASGVINGNAIQSQDAGATLQMWEAASTDDTITLDGTTRGGIKGDRIDLIDIATNTWQAVVTTAATGTEATPFSATV